MGRKPKRTPPKQTLVEIRKRAREGKSLRRADVRNTALFDRARRDFGGWTEALVKAGLRQDGASRARTGGTATSADRTKLELSTALLRGPRSTHELSRLTGVDRKTIRTRRARLGIQSAGGRRDRNQGEKPANSGKDGSRKNRGRTVIPEPRERIDPEEAARLYGEGLSYIEIGRRLGWTASTVSTTLKKHGVKKRRPFSQRVRDPRRLVLFTAWNNMRQRCNNPTCSLYHLYGARGVEVCAEWDRLEPFYYWALESGFRKGLYLDLIEPSLGYRPGNCRWISKKKVIRRAVQRQEHPKYEAFGEERTLSGWVRDRRCSVTLAGLEARLRTGWPVEEAITTPPYAGRGANRVPPGAGRKLTAFGEKKSVVAWSDDKRCRVSSATLAYRLDCGYLHEEALTAPPGKRWSDADRKRGWRDKGARYVKVTTAVDWDEVVRWHVEDGLGSADIARRLGTTHTTIHNGLRKRCVLSDRPPSKRENPERFRLYQTWTSLRQRCLNPNANRFDGDPRSTREICEEWSQFEPFYQWAKASGARVGLCMLRIDSRAAYSPENCRWTTREETTHAANPPRMPAKARWTLTAFGETKGPTAWSRDKRCAVSLTTLIKRLRSGEPTENALTLPPATQGNKDSCIRAIEAFGVTKGLIAWSRDPRCKVSWTALRYRIERGVDAETAMTVQRSELPIPPEWRTEHSAPD